MGRIAPNIRIASATVVVMALVPGGCGRVDFGARPAIAVDAARADADLGLLACDSSNPDLVGCWAFEDNTLDGSQYHNDATPSDVTFAPGHDGLSATTDANTQLLLASSPSLTVTTAFTVEAWVLIPAYPASGAAFLFDDDIEYTLLLKASGVIGANVNSSPSTYVESSEPVGLGAWHHVSFRYDMAATLDVVIDGAIAASVPASGPVTGVGTAGSRIAGDAGIVGTLPYVGTIDDVRVWRVVRPLADL